MLNLSKRLLALLGASALITAAATAMFWALPAVADGVAGAAGVTAGGESVGWGYVAAALATGLSALGAGYAVAGVGSAAIGALAEKPELLGRILIMVGLAEGIAIYGLIISILILNKVL